MKFLDVDGCGLSINIIASNLTKLANAEPELIAVVSIGHSVFSLTIRLHNDQACLLLANKNQLRVNELHLIKETLIKSFDRLRTNGKWLISFVVSLSNHEWNQLVQSFLN